MKETLNWRAVAVGTAIIWIIVASMPDYSYVFNF